MSWSLALSRPSPNARPRSSDEVVSRIRGSLCSAAQVLRGAREEGAAVGLPHRGLAGPGLGWGLELKGTQ